MLFCILRVSISNHTHPHAHPPAHSQRSFVCAVYPALVQLIAEETTLSWSAHMDSILDHRWVGSDDARVVTASADRTAKLWDLGTQRCVATMVGHRGSVKSVRPCPINDGAFSHASLEAVFHVRE